MRLCVTSWSFPQLTLDEVGGVARVLGLEGVDVGYFYTASLDKARLLAEPQVYGFETRSRLPVSVPNLYHLFGNGLSDRNLALGPDPENLADFRRVLQFVTAVGASTVFILPGIINPGQSRSQALAASAEALKPLVGAAEECGVVVTLEPHVHGILESIDMTHDLLVQVPGLRITLDPAHFVAMGFRQEEIETLAPHAGHVHLRQAKPGVLQTRLDAGVINFPALLGALRQSGYDRWLAIEYVHQAYMDTLHDDVLTETVKMRDLIRGWLA